MSTHNAPKQLYSTYLKIEDPGDAGSIIVDRVPAIVQLVSAAAETRTLARPEFVGATLSLHMKTDGGDITLTVTGGYNEAGDTTFTFSDPGQFATFLAVEYGGAFYWRLTGHDGFGDVSRTESAALNGLTSSVSELNILDGVTATATEINAACDFPAAQTVAVTADGLTTGLIAATTKIAILTSDGADKIATLPGIAASTLGIGHTIRGRIAGTGCEIRTLASSNETINGVDADGGAAEMALGANTTFTAIVESATGWLVSTGTATAPD